MAEQKFLKLTISRVDGPLFNGEVVAVSVPGAQGDMQLLAHHEALISPLKRGVVSVEKVDKSKETFEIEGGTLEVSNNHATILV